MRPLGGSGEGLAGEVVPKAGDFVEGYLRERQRRGELTPLTVRNDRCILRNFAASAGARPVDKLSQRDVEKWLGDIGHLAPATRRGRFSVVRTYCRWLVSRGHLRRDPTVGLRGPRQPRSVPRALQEEAVAATLAVCPDARARLIVTLMVQQGLRCCEVHALQLGDFDIHRGTMRVVGKGGHERILPVMCETTEAIASYLAEHPAVAGPLIRSYRDPHRGLAADTISGLVGEWVAAAGIKQHRRDGVSAHAFRHTAATDMLLNGAHLRTVQHALGHAHLSTTEIYLPYVVDSLEKAMGGRRYRTV